MKKKIKINLSIDKNASTLEFATKKFSPGFSGFIDDINLEFMTGNRVRFKSPNNNAILELGESDSLKVISIWIGENETIVTSEYGKFGILERVCCCVICGGRKICVCGSGCSASCA